MKSVTTIYYDTPFKVCPNSSNNWSVVDNDGYIIATCPTEHAAKFVCEKSNVKEELAKKYFDKGYCL